ncbi:hypothetical protein [Ramlibacter pallidus]|uniref:Uncharacterized protein n=1 Tax=Ramlibacter pallidus TaxID=2780087 RepID=A0ABR9S1P3_9BURK|nr:hypothetical protein [Ramlibacter pallidus]MBE7367423.1 hypothetical protein [Ramlibacter pallidus]
MQIFSWFRVGEAEAFGRELAAFMVQEHRGELDALNVKQTKRATKVMVKATRKIQEFRATHRLNVYQKSKLANAFLWQLKDGGWPPEYAEQVTEWLTLQL